MRVFTSCWTGILLLLAGCHGSPLILERTPVLQERDKLNTPAPALELVIPVNAVTNPDKPGYIRPQTFQAFLCDYLPQECQSRFANVSVKNAPSNLLVSRIVIESAQGVVLDDTGVILEAVISVQTPDGMILFDKYRISGKKDGIKGTPIPFRPQSALTPQMMKAADEFLVSFRNDILQPCYEAAKEAQ